MKSIVFSGAPAVALSFDVDPAFIWGAVPSYVAKLRISDGKAVAVFGRAALDIAIAAEKRPSALDFAGRQRGARH